MTRTRLSETKVHKVQGHWVVQHTALFDTPKTYEFDSYEAVLSALATRRFK